MAKNKMSATKWRAVFEKKSCYRRENQCGGVFGVKESKFLVEKTKKMAVTKWRTEKKSYRPEN